LLKAIGYASYVLRSPAVDLGKLEGVELARRAVEIGISKQDRAEVEVFHFSVPFALVRGKVSPRYARVNNLYQTWVQEGEK
jgi:predicted transcriptional regulator